MENLAEDIHAKVEVVEIAQGVAARGEEETDDENSCTAESMMLAKRNLDARWPAEAT